MLSYVTLSQYCTRCRGPVLCKPSRTGSHLPTKLGAEAQTCGAKKGQRYIPEMRPDNDHRTVSKIERLNISAASAALPLLFDDENCVGLLLIFINVAIKASQLNEQANF